MDPTEFLKTAELLKTHTEQPHLRTSVGRSYYAAILFFRERLKNLGLEKKKHPSQQAHDFVIQCLRFSGVTEAVKASQNLKDLQQVREDADYRLERIFSQNDAEDTFVKAKKLINDFKQKMTKEKEKTLLNSVLARAKQKDWI